MFDNWRHGTMLFAIPDAVAGDAEGNVTPRTSRLERRSAVKTSTSCDNQYSTT